MTSPANPVIDPAVRARVMLGTALGVVVPEAITLEDGSVRLTGPRDLLAADRMDRLAGRLATRFADGAPDERILVESVALLGAEVTRSRGGSAPADGSTAALDALLDVPDLPQPTRREAEALLRGVLEGNADTSDTAAARLAELSARERRPVPADVLAAAREIAREAQVLRRTQPATVPSRAPGSGRHRRAVGRHRRQRGTATTQMRDTTRIGGPRSAGAGSAGGRSAGGRSAGGRSAGEPDLTERGALDALRQVRASDLGNGVTADPEVLDRPQVAVFETAQHGRQHVRVEIADPGHGRLASADIRSGRVDDPHVLRIGPRESDARVASIWVNQFSRIHQEVAANRPTGLFAKIRSALKREGRARALEAQYNEFRLMARTWRETRTQELSTGQATGPQSATELEQDLRGLAGAIDRRGGTAPAFPWTPEAVVVPVVASAGMTTPAVTVAPNSPAHLRERVNVEIGTLDRVVDDLQARVDAKTSSAETATNEAGGKRTEAAEEAAKQDYGAPERARKLLVEASKAEGKAKRHTEIAAAYQVALGAADQARTSYQALGAGLDAMIADPRSSGAEVLQLSQTAADQVEEYRECVAKALPRRDVLHSGAPTARLPHLTALTGRINEALAKAARDTGRPPYEFTPELLHRTLRAEFRRVMSPDGLVLPVGGDASDEVGKLTQLRLKLKPGELAEVIDPDVKLAELMVGQLEQGGHSVSGTATSTFGRSGGFSLKTVMAMLPDSNALKAASSVVAPGFEFAFGRSRSVTTAATEYALGGAVEDNRGESLLFEGTAAWEIDVRTSALDEWSPAGRVERSGPRDADALKVWVSAAYAVGPPKNTVDLTQVGRGEVRDPALPEHVATDVRGLNELTDKTIRSARERIGVLDRVAHDQLRNLLTEELPSRLDEATKPGGIGRLIYSGGKPVAYAQVETEVVWDQVELVGEASSEHWQERLRVGFSGATGNEAYNASTSGSVTLGYPGTALADIGSSSTDLGPTVKAGRSTARGDSLSAGGTAIHPSVQRYTGPTQGYRMRLKHKVTVHQVGGDGFFTEDSAGTALLRIPENDAYRCGLPVDAAAVKRTPDGQPMEDKHGRTLLRGDPQPTEVDLQLPTWMGNNRGQLRGAGPALVQQVTGAEKALADTARELSRQELLPPLDAQGRPRMDALPNDPLLRQSQLQNFERLSQHISALRLETGYDQAAQGGLPLALVEHRRGHPPKVRTLRLSLQQKFDEARCLGVTESEAVVNLDIASRTSTRSGNRSKRLPWLATLGVGDKPEAGQAGQTREIGPSYGRAALGRLIAWASGGTGNGVLLAEATAPAAAFEVPHTLVITEVTESGDSEPLAKVDGSATVLLDTELLAQEDVPEATPYQGITKEAVLDKAKVLHVDVGDPMSRLQAALPAVARPGSAAYHHLATFVNPRSLIANSEWRSTEFRTRLAVGPTPSTPGEAIAQRGILPRQASVSLKATVSNHQFLRATHQVTGDINLTLSSYSTTEGSSTGNKAGLSSGSGVAGGVGGSQGGSLGWNRSGNESRSRTDAQIWGWERLRIEIGQHYVFKADLAFEAELTDGASTEPSKLKLDDGTVLFAVAERDALRLYGQRQLDLPLHQVADAAERFLEGDLKLDRRTAAAFVRRYESEKKGATEGLAPSHTRERLAERVRAAAGLGEAEQGTPAENLEDTLEKVDELVKKTTEVSLPEPYGSMMGAALVEETEFTNETGDQVDVHAAVRAAVEQAAPDTLERDAVLPDALFGDLAGKRWQGHLDDMLDPRGFVREYPVQTSGTGPPEVIRVRVRAVFDGPVVTDGSEESALSIVQGYDYEEHSRNRTHSTSHAVNAGATATEGLAGNVGLGTDQSRSRSASSGEQSTRLQRMMHDKMTRVEREMRIVVEVEKLPVVGGATKGLVRRNADHELEPQRGQVQLSGRMTQLVPTKLLNTAPTPPPTPEREDHRTVTLPGSFFVEGTRPYLQGEPEADKLFATVAGRLSQRDMLSENGVRMHRTELENQLSASARSAAFERIASGEGHAMVRLPVAGHRSQVVDVRVKAVVSDLQLVGEPIDNVQLGEVDRVMRTTRASTTGNKLMPVSGAGGGGAPAADLKGEVSVGEQFSSTDSDLTGNRHELSKFEVGTVVTVRVRVEYDLTFKRKGLDRHGNEKVKKSDQLHQVAAGEAYLTMFQHEYLAMRERMETGAALSSALEGLDPQIAGRAHTAFEFTENSAGQAEYHPYQPLLDALTEARKEETTLQVTMYEQSGQQRTYQAMPDGTMRGTDDGGFGAAFATLHPRLAKLAEGRVDLRELFNQTERTKHFSGAVSKALQESGVPASVLTELDHSLAARSAAARTASNGARQSLGAHTSANGTGLSVS